VTLDDYVLSIDAERKREEEEEEEEEGDDELLLLLLPVLCDHQSERYVPIHARRIKPPNPPQLSTIQMASYSMMIMMLVVLTNPPCVVLFSSPPLPPFSLSLSLCSR